MRFRPGARVWDEWHDVFNHARSAQFWADRERGGRLFSPGNYEVDIDRPMGDHTRRHATRQRRLRVAKDIRKMMESLHLAITHLIQSDPWIVDAAE